MYGRKVIYCHLVKLDTTNDDTFISNFHFNKISIYQRLVSSITEL